MSKPVILTGLRANNDLHIGNYFGALLPLIDMAKNKANEYEINLFVPDLHSFTTPIDHSKLSEQIMHNLRLFVAAGLPLDHNNIHIYRQSYIPAHSELTWILDCFTGFGEMSRMTQFKEKANTVANKIEAELPYNNAEGAALVEAAGSRLSLGLFNYPVLMAADVLLYGATYIPVGDDQSQHLEFARDIAQRMNNKFGDLFVVPEPVAKQHEFFGNDQGLRIKDLVYPEKKMSKSDQSNHGIIFLGDTPEDAANKIKGATTDSLGIIHAANKEQAGIQNLLQILALVKGVSYGEAALPYQGQAMYGSLKADVADNMSKFLTDFQQRLAAVDDDQLLSKLETDEKQMNDVANATLYTVQKAVGLRS